MTPDLDEIRRVLAAATPNVGHTTQAVIDAHQDLVANAPTWLAAFCTEVERLRELSAQLQVEQDVALAEVERLRADTQELNAGWTECAVERDAALAENERLRDHVMVEMAEQIREARRIAQQLAAALREHVRLTRPIQSTREALAEYDAQDWAKS